MLWEIAQRNFLEFTLGFPGKGPAHAVVSAAGVNRQRRARPLSRPLLELALALHEPNATKKRAKAFTLLEYYLGGDCEFFLTDIAHHRVKVNCSLSRVDLLFGTLEHSIG